MPRLDTRRRIARITVGALLMGWGVAWASVAATYPDLIGLPWAQVGVGVLIAAWGGATATLGRYLASAYEQRPFLWRPEIVRDSAVSVSVGAGAYLVGWTWQLSPPMLGLVLLLAGYGGTRVLSVALERMLLTVTRRD